MVKKQLPAKRQRSTATKKSKKSGISVGKTNNFLKNKMFLVFVLLFAVVGVFMIYRSFAATAPVVGKVEAETFKLPSGSKVVANAKASGGKAIRMNSNGTATGTINISATSANLAIVAKGRVCNGAPKMTIAIDGVTASTITVSNTSYTSYPITTTVSAASHSVSVSFINDYSNNSCSRDLFVDLITFYGQETTPPPAVAACANGLDDDKDGKVDYPTDPGCSSTSDTDETDPVSGGTNAWKPVKPGVKWQWQLTGTVNETVLDSYANVPKLYDIDMFNTSAATIGRLKAKGIYVVCYVETGDWAKDRPDAGDYATAILGKTLNGFPDEKFVNINALDSPAGPTGKTLRQIMTARLDLAKSKGCDGVEPDLDDLHNYSTGFTITQANQVAFNTFLIKTAHERGMSLGLKNGASSTTGTNSFEQQMLNAGADWALNEECNQYSECAGYSLFVNAGKAVLQVEYQDNQRVAYSGSNGTCAKNNAANFDGIVKDSSSKLSALPLIFCR